MSTSFPLLGSSWAIDTHIASLIFDGKHWGAGRALLCAILLFSVIIILREIRASTLRHGKRPSFLNWRLVYMLPLLLLIVFPNGNFSLSTSLLRSEVTAKADYERARLRISGQDITVVESLDDFKTLAIPSFDGSAGSWFSFLVPDGQVNRINGYLTQLEESKSSAFQSLLSEAKASLEQRVSSLRTEISSVRARMDIGCPFLDNGEPSDNCLRNQDALRSELAQLNKQLSDVTDNGIDFASIGIDERLAMSAVSIVRNEQQDQYQTYELTLLVTIVSILVLAIFILKECTYKRPIAALLVPVLVGAAIFCLFPMLLPSAWLSFVGLGSYGQLYYFMPIGHFIGFALFSLLGMAFALFVRDTRLLRAVVWRSPHRQGILKQFFSLSTKPILAILFVFVIFSTLSALLVDKAYSTSFGDLESGLGFVGADSLDVEYIPQEALRCADESGMIGVVFPTADDCGRNFEDDVFGSVDLWFEAASSQAVASIDDTSRGFADAGQDYVDSLNTGIERAIPFSLSTHTASEQGQRGISPAFDHNYSVCWRCLTKWLQRKVKRRADGSYIGARDNGLDVISSRLQSAYESGTHSLPELEQIAKNETALLFNRLKSETSAFLLAAFRIQDVVGFFVFSSFLIAALKFFGHLFVRAALDDKRVLRAYQLHFPYGPEQGYLPASGDKASNIKSSAGPLPVRMSEGESGTCRWGYDPDATNLQRLKFHLPLAEIPKRVFAFSYFYRSFTQSSEGGSNVKLKNAAGSSLTSVSLGDGETVRFDLAKLYGVIGSPKLWRTYSFEPVDLLRFKMRHFSACGKGQLVFRTLGEPNIKLTKSEEPSSIYRLLVWPSEGGMNLVSDRKTTGVFFGRVQFKCREVKSAQRSREAARNFPIIFDSDDGDFAKSLRPFFLVFSLFLPF